MGQLFYSCKMIEPVSITVSTNVYKQDLLKMIHEEMILDFFYDFCGAISWDLWKVLQLWVILYLLETF